MSEEESTNQDKNQPLIKVDSVGQIFHLPSGDVQILYDISLTIKHNSFTIIYGPSGSGKTTLFNILSGLQPPSSGKVLVDKTYVYDLSKDERAFFRSQKIGLVHQVNYWVKSLSVIENVAMPMYVAGYDMGQANQKAMEILKKMEMDKYARYHPSLLSGGQQQRVSMARALIVKPPLIFADEPTGNLDSTNGKMIMDLLKSVQKDFLCTIILITHNLDYLPYSDNQIHIVDGHIIPKGAKVPATADKT